MSFFKQLTVLAKTKGYVKNSNSVDSLTDYLQRNLSCSSIHLSGRVIGGLLKVSGSITCNANERQIEKALEAWGTNSLPIAIIEDINIRYSSSDNSYNFDVTFDFE